MLSRVGRYVGLLFGVLIVIQCNCGSATAQSIEIESIHPARDKADLLWVSSDWAVWRKSTLIEETRHHRGQSFKHKYYRQSLTEDAARLMLEHSDGSGRPQVTVTNQGDLVLTERGHYVAWHSNAGTKSLSTEIKGLIVQLYPDGVLAKVPQKGAITYIPFDGRWLATDRTIEIAPAGIERLQHRDPVRNNATFAWSTRGAIHLVDIASGKHRLLNTPQFLGDQHIPSNFVVAFDDQTIISSAQAYDATNGEILGNVKYWEKGYSNRWLIAVRNRIGYYLQEKQILAREIDSSTREARLVSDAPHLPIAQNSDGLILWTGTEWKRIPWLTSFPDR